MEGRGPYGPPLTTCNASCEAGSRRLFLLATGTGEEVWNCTQTLCVIGLLLSLAKVAAMKKRIQVNVSLEDSEIGNINEYCRVHGITPQGLFKAGAQRL